MIMISRRYGNLLLCIPPQYRTGSCVLCWNIRLWLLSSVALSLIFHVVVKGAPLSKPYVPYRTSPYDHDGKIHTRWNESDGTKINMTSIVNGRDVLDDHQQKLMCYMDFQIGISKRYHTAIMDNPNSIEAYAIRYPPIIQRIYPHLTDKKQVLYHTQYEHIDVLSSSTLVQSTTANYHNLQEQRQEKQVKPKTKQQQQQQQQRKISSSNKKEKSRSNLHDYNKNMNRDYHSMMMKHALIQLPQFPLLMESSSYSSSPILHDVNGDGIMEIISCDYDGGITIMSLANNMKGNKKNKKNKYHYFHRTQIPRLHVRREWIEIRIQDEIKTKFPDHSGEQNETTDTMKQQRRTNYDPYHSYFEFYYSGGYGNQKNGNNKKQSLVQGKTANVFQQDHDDAKRLIEPRKTNTDKKKQKWIEYQKQAKQRLEEQQEKEKLLLEKHRQEQEQENERRQQLANETNVVEDEKNSNNMNQIEFPLDMDGLHGQLQQNGMMMNGTSTTNDSVNTTEQQQIKTIDRKLEGDNNHKLEDMDITNENTEIHGSTDHNDRRRRLQEVNDDDSYHEDPTTIHRRLQEVDNDKKERDSWNELERLRHQFPGHLDPHMIHDRHRRFQEEGRVIDAHHDHRRFIEERMKERMREQLKYHHRKRMLNPDDDAMKTHEQRIQQYSEENTKDDMTRDSEEDEQDEKEQDKKEGGEKADPVLALFGDEITEEGDKSSADQQQQVGQQQQQQTQEEQENKDENDPKESFEEIERKEEELLNGITDDAALIQALQEQGEGGGGTTDEEEHFRGSYDDYDYRRHYGYGDDMYAYDNANADYYDSKHYIRITPHVLTDPILVEVPKSYTNDIDDKDDILLVPVSYYFDEDEYDGLFHFNRFEDAEDIGDENEVRRGAFVANAIMAYNVHPDSLRWMGQTHLDLSTDYTAPNNVTQMGPLPELSDTTNMGAFALSTPTVADIDGDTNPEIIIGTSLGIVYLLDARQLYQRNNNWPVQMEFPIETRILVEDVVNDTNLEVFVMDIGSNIACFSHDGNVVWRRNLLSSIGYFDRQHNGTSPTLSGSSSMTLGDIDGDGMLDIVVLIRCRNANDDTSYLFAVEARNGIDKLHFPIALKDGKPYVPDDLRSMHNKLPQPLLVDLHTDQSFLNEYIRRNSTEYINRNDNKGTTIKSNYTFSPYGGYGAGLHVVQPHGDEVFIIEGSTGCIKRISIGDEVSTMIQVDDVHGTNLLDLIIATSSGNIITLETQVPYHPLNTWTHGEVRSLYSNTHAHGYSASQGIFIHDISRYQNDIFGVYVPITFEIFDHRPNIRNEPTKRIYRVDIRDGSSHKRSLFRKVYNETGVYHENIFIKYGPGYYTLFVVLTTSHGIMYEDSMSVRYNIHYMNGFGILLWLPLVVAALVIVTLGSGNSSNDVDDDDTIDNRRDPHRGLLG